MITLTEMENRVKSLLAAVENSIKEHHLLVGQAREAEGILEYMKSKDAEVKTEDEADKNTNAIVESQVETVVEAAQ
jgi:hypothetical protein